MSVDTRRTCRSFTVILAAVVVLAAVGCATDEAAEGETLRESLRDAQYVQRERGLKRLSADVLVRVGPSQAKTAEGGESHRLVFHWEDPDTLEIRPAEETSEPEVAEKWAKQLRRLANLVVKRDMPASHEADSIRRDGDRIVAERDKANGEGIVRVIATADGKMQRMHHMVPDSEGEGYVKKMTFEVSNREVDGDYLADGMTLFKYEGPPGDKQRRKILSVRAEFTDVPVDEGTVKVGNFVELRTPKGNRVVYELENISTDDE